MTASACVNASNGCLSPVSVSNIQGGLFSLLSNAPDFPVVLDAIALAASGDGSIFAQYAGDPLPNVESAWALPLVCGDYCEFEVDLGEDSC